MVAWLNHREVLRDFPAAILNKSQLNLISFCYILCHETIFLGFSSSVWWQSKGLGPFEFQGATNSLVITDYCLQKVRKAAAFLKLTVLFYLFIILCFHHYVRIYLSYVTAKGAKTRGAWGDISLPIIWRYPPPIIWKWSTSAFPPIIWMGVHLSKNSGKKLFYSCLKTFFLV